MIGIFEPGDFPIVVDAKVWSRKLEFGSGVSGGVECRRCGAELVPVGDYHVFYLLRQVQGHECPTDVHMPRLPDREPPP